MADDRKTFVYEARLYCGGRRPKLWLVTEGRIYRFAGTAIPKVVAVLGENGCGEGGKWWGVAYTLMINPQRTVGVELLAPLHGKTWPQLSLGEALAWLNVEVSRELPGATPVSEQEFREALMMDYPTTLQRWDNAAALSADL